MVVVVVVVVAVEGVDDKTLCYRSKKTMVLPSSGLETREE